MGHKSTTLQIGGAQFRRGDIHYGTVGIQYMYFVITKFCKFLHVVVCTLKNMQLERSKRSSVICTVFPIWGPVYCTGVAWRQSAFDPWERAICNLGYREGECWTLSPERVTAWVQLEKWRGLAFLILGMKIDWRFSSWAAPARAGCTDRSATGRVRVILYQLRSNA